VLSALVTHATTLPVTVLQLIPGGGGLTMKKIQKEDGGGGET
jgi:hypothetical protein